MDFSYPSCLGGPGEALGPKSENHSLPAAQNKAGSEQPKTRRDQRADGGVCVVECVLWFVREPAPRHMHDSESAANDAVPITSACCIIMMEMFFFTKAQDV